MSPVWGAITDLLLWAAVLLLAYRLLKLEKRIDEDRRR